MEAFDSRDIFDCWRSVVLISGAAVANDFLSCYSQLDLPDMSSAILLFRISHPDGDATLHGVVFDVSSRGGHIPAPMMD
jgi:hypothetical protein